MKERGISSLDQVKLFGFGPQFAGRDLFNRLTKNGGGVEKPVSWIGNVWGVLFQMMVATYGGYFGAGIGILMLAALSLLGLTDIHQMNGLKTLFALCINVVATTYFIAVGLVELPVAATMAGAP